MRGWWIYRHRNDRSAQNIFGLLGATRLVIQPASPLLNLDHQPPSTVASSGLASHRFTCTLARKSAAKYVVFRCGSQLVKVPVPAQGTVQGIFKLPAKFGEVTVQAAVLNGQGHLLDSTTRIQKINRAPICYLWHAQPGDRFKGFLIVK